MIYGYVRVSTDMQDTESQKIGVVRKAAELGLTIEEWISDNGVSGTKEYDKRNLGILMDKLKEGDIVIVSEISRLARSVFMLFRIVEFCTITKNCTIYSVKENQCLKKNDAMSTIILSAYGTAAQIEREMIVKRVKEGMERCRKKGVVLGRPTGISNQKSGYDKVKDLVKNLISKDVRITTISRITGLSRSSLAIIISRYNLRYKKKKSRHRGNYSQIFLESKFALIERMID